MLCVPRPPTPTPPGTLCDVLACLPSPRASVCVCACVVVWVGGWEGARQVLSDRGADRRDCAVVNQLELICAVIGTPNEDDMAHIKYDKVRGPGRLQCAEGAMGPLHVIGACSPRCSVSQARAHLHSLGHKPKIPFEQVLPAGTNPLGALRMCCALLCRAVLQLLDGELTLLCFAVHCHADLGCFHHLPSTTCPAGSAVADCSFAST